jgi:hypothetical protein
VCPFNVFSVSRRCDKAPAEDSGGTRARDRGGDRAIRETCTPVCQDSPCDRDDGSKQDDRNKDADGALIIHSEEGDADGKDKSDTEQHHQDRVKTPGAEDKIRPWRVADLHNVQR